MAWDATGWTYYKVLTIDQTDTVNANYQIKLLVGKSSSATGEQVDCADHCEADFDDLRFTTDAAPASATLLDYWIESISGSGSSALATVWVEVTLPNNANDVTIRMYYGNAGASAPDTSQNMGIATFPFFDHFDDAGLDTAKWDIIGGTPAVSSSECVLTGTANEHIRSDNAVLKMPGILRAKVKTSNLGVYADLIGFTDTAGVAFMALFNNYSTANAVNLRDIAHDENNQVVSGISVNTYYVMELYRTTGYITKAYLNDTYKVTNTRTLNNVTEDLKIYSRSYDDTHVTTIDWILVRNYTANEPAFSSFGAETSTGWANIAKVNGIASADMAKVNGIAVADIAKIYGVAV